MKEQAGCLPIRATEDGGIQLLLVTSRKAQQKGLVRWGFPKGSIESKERNQKAAKRETKEEAGVDGEVIYKVGVYHREHEPPVDAYILRVDSFDEHFEEEGQRLRKWYTLAEAKQLPMEPYVAKLLHDFEALLPTLQLHPAK